MIWITAALAWTVQAAGTNPTHLSDGGGVDVWQGVIVEPIGTHRAGGYTHRAALTAQCHDGKLIVDLWTGAPTKGAISLDTGDGVWSLRSQPWAMGGRQRLFGPRPALEAAVKSGKIAVSFRARKEQRVRRRLAVTTKDRQELQHLLEQCKG